MLLPEKKVLSERGEQKSQLQLTKELGQVLTSSEALDNGLLTMSGLLYSMGNHPSLAQEIFKLLAQENDQFSRITVLKGEEENVKDQFEASIKINGLEQPVSNSVATVLQVAEVIAGERGVRLDTGHVLEAMIKNYEPALFRLLKGPKANEEFNQRFLVNLVSISREEHLYQEQVSGPEASLVIHKSIKNLMELASSGELSGHRIPTAWFKVLVGQLRKEDRVLLDTASELEVQLMAMTLAEQITATKNPPIQTKSIVFMCKEDLLRDGKAAIVTLLSKTQKGIVFLPNLENEPIEMSILQMAARNGVKLVVYGDNPKGLDFPNPTEEEMVVMFAPLKDQFEEYLSVDGKPLTITDESLKVAAEVGLRYAGALGCRPLDAMAALLEEAALNLHLTYAELPMFTLKDKLVDWDGRIDPADVYRAIYDKTGIEVQADNPERYLQLETELSKSIIGQPEAIKAVSKAIRRAKAGLKDPNRPIANFMFLGPTAVGKTELTKALANFLFGSEKQLIVLDMSEYIDKMNISRLTGTAPGYVGYEDEGNQLTDLVRKQPYSVVVFDEIEKAHPEVWNILYQIMEEGRLTDGHGRVVDFRNTVVVMTGNVGEEWYKQLGKLTEEEVAQKVIGEAKLTFKPAFLNRLDRLIVFRSLSKENIGQIVSLQVEKTNKKLKTKQVAVVISDEVKKILTEKAFSPEYNAREVRRVVQSEIEDRLENPMIEGKIVAGDRVMFDLEKEEIVWRVEKAG